MEERTFELKKLYDRYIKKVADFLKQTCGEDVFAMISWLKYMDSFNNKNVSSMLIKDIYYSDLDYMYGISNIIEGPNGEYHLNFIYDVLRSAGKNVYFAEGTSKDSKVTSYSVLFIENNEKIYCYGENFEELLPIKLDLVDRRFVVDVDKKMIKKIEFDIEFFSYMNELSQNEIASIIGSIYKFRTKKQKIEKVLCGSNEEIIFSPFLMNLNELGFEIKTFYENEFCNKEFKR